jgi:hypothetical protein
MPVRRVNPNLIKLNRSYTVSELAARVGVHQNTVRHWVAQGLAPVDHSRPLLFRGDQVRAFLAKLNAGRKQPCPPGTLYCLHCRQPREPALGMVDCVDERRGIGNLKALCWTCETVMHRRVRVSDLSTLMPGLDIVREAPSRLGGLSEPSLNCDFER